MATQNLLTVEQYAALDEPVGVRYELSNGELIVTPSASHFHNAIRDNVNSSLREFVAEHALGDVTCETDIQLAPGIVRRPDVAFFRAGRLENVDLDEVPLPVAPDLAVEVVFRNDRGDDLMLKVKQYLEAGAQAVWLVYPKLGQAYRYLPGKMQPEVRTVDEGGAFAQPELLPGFSLPLAEVLP